MSDPSALTFALEKAEVDFVPQLPSLTVERQLAKSPDVIISNKGGEAIGPVGWLAVGTDADLTQAPTFE